MNIPEISKDQARQIAIRSQLLHRPHLKSDKGSKFIQTINSLGYIQIDTISVVNRAHHQTLWARTNGYQEDIIHKLQFTDRKIYEYWGHAMSFLPVDDFRFSLPKMNKFKDPKSKWIKTRAEKTKPLLNDVLKRVRAEGPLSSKDFKSESNKKGGTWWDWKPAKMALEVLFWQGELMITERKNFQKIYDLPERVLPAGINTKFPTIKESAEYIILGALRSMGIASEKEIQKYKQAGASRDAEMSLVENKEIKKCINDLIEEKTIVRVIISGIDNQYYMLTSEVNEFSKKNKISPNVRLLSPFDNLIIQRDRTKKIFNFDYTLECYVPEPKRKFGYFVFPILYGNNLIGRMDPKADRKTKTLIIKNLYFEPDFKDYESFLPLFIDELKRFSTFNSCNYIKIENCANTKIVSDIRSKLKL